MVMMGSSTAALEPLWELLAKPNNTTVLHPWSLPDHCYSEQGKYRVLDTFSLNLTFVNLELFPLEDKFDGLRTATRVNLVAAQTIQAHFDNGVIADREHNQSTLSITDSAFETWNLLADDDPPSSRPPQAPSQQPTHATVEDSQRHQITYRLNQIFLQETNFRIGLGELRSIQKTLSRVFPTRFSFGQIF